MSDASPRLARSAGLFGLATMASRILGLVRDQVLAYYFGAGDAMDAFRVAFRVPNLVRDLFAEGAMSAAFVPTFTRRLTDQGREGSWPLANSVINALILITGVLVIAFIVFADPLVRFYASDFAQVPGKLELTVYLARIMAPFLMLVAVAAALMGMLNSLGHFFVPALSPAMFNVATIVIAVAGIPFAPALGIQPIVLIAAATIAGGLGQLALQWRPLRHEGFRYRPTLDIHEPGLRQVLMLMGPGSIGMAATQINLLVNTQFASSQGTGAVSWLDYAFRVMYLPIGLFGVSIAAASTPALSRLAALDDKPQMRTTIASAIGLMLALNIPATVGLAVLAHPIIALIFERGSFTADDTAATALALQYYAVGLVGYSVVRIVSPAFYALHRSRVPVMASIASVVVNIALNIVLIRVLGYAGLALGTSIAAIVNGLVQIVVLRRALGGIQAARIITSFARVAAASVVMGAAAWTANETLLQYLPGTSLWLQGTRVVATIVVAMAVLTIAAMLLRVHEFQEAKSLIVGRFRRLAR